MPSTLKDPRETLDELDDPLTSEAVEHTSNSRAHQMTQEQPRKTGRLRRFVGTVVVVGALAAAVVAVWPVVRVSVLQPVEAATFDIDAVETDVKGNSSRLDLLDEQLAAVQAESTARGRIDTAHEATLERLDKVVTELVAEQDAQSGVLDGLKTEARTTTSAQAGLQTQLDLIQRLLVHESALNSAGLHMLRARQAIYESSYGVATDGMETANAVLSTTVADSTVAEVMLRLERAGENLPERPVAAAGDLDIAWQLLANDISLDVTTDNGERRVEGATGLESDAPSDEQDTSQSPAGE